MLLVHPLSSPIRTSVQTNFGPHFRPNAPRTGHSRPASHHVSEICSMTRRDWGLRLWDLHSEADDSIGIWNYITVSGRRLQLFQDEDDQHHHRRHSESGHSICRRTLLVSPIIPACDGRVPFGLRRLHTTCVRAGVRRLATLRDPFVPVSVARMALRLVLLKPVEGEPDVYRHLSLRPLHSLTLVDPRWPLVESCQHQAPWPSCPLPALGSWAGAVEWQEHQCPRPRPCSGTLSCHHVLLHPCGTSLHHRCGLQCLLRNCCGG